MYICTFDYNAAMSVGTGGLEETAWGLSLIGRSYTFSQKKEKLL